MPLNCEVCGSSIRGPPATVSIDGAIFRVCNTCARLGIPAPSPRARATSTLQKLQPRFEFREPTLELAADFHKIIRQAREKAGLSQDQFARSVNEKVSVVKHLESRKFKPDNVLARKIEHYLKVKIFVPVEEE